MTYQLKILLSSNPGDDLNVENDTNVYELIDFFYTPIISMLVDTRPPRVPGSEY